MNSDRIVWDSILDSRTRKTDQFDVRRMHDPPPRYWNSGQRRLLSLVLYDSLLIPICFLTRMSMRSLHLLVSVFQR